MIAIAPLYLFLFGVKSRPGRAVLVGIGFFLLWPKVGLHRPEFLSEMSAYVLIWPVTISAMVLSVLLHRTAAAGRPERDLRRCLWAAAAAATVSFTASWFLGARQGLWSDAFDPRLRVYDYVVLMQAVGFSYLFMRGIHRVDQAEAVFRLFAFGGGALIVEAIAFAYLKIPSPGGWALEARAGRFQSLLYSSFNDVGFSAILAFASILYFAVSRCRLAWYCVAAACVLPILATFERAPLVGLFFAGGLVFVVMRRRRLRAMLLLAAAGFALLGVFAVFGDELGTILGGGARKDYASGTTLAYRLALWIRGFEVGVAAFPWGVGPGMTSAQMSCPAHSLLGTRFWAQNADLWETYEQLASGVYRSDAHNLLLTSFIENGLLGVLAGILVLATFLRNLSSLLRFPIPDSGDSRRAYLVWACACAALTGLGIHYFFDVRPILFFMILPLLHICSICRRELYGPERSARG